MINTTTVAPLYQENPKCPKNGVLARLRRHAKIRQRARRNCPGTVEWTLVFPSMVIIQGGQNAKARVGGDRDSQPNIYAVIIRSFGETWQSSALSESYGSQRSDGVATCRLVIQFR